MTSYATRLQAAEAAVIVLSADKAVTDWSARYFGPWWNAVDAKPESVCGGPLVVAEVDEEAYGEASLAVAQAPHTSTTYAKAQTLVSRDDAAGVMWTLTQLGRPALVMPLRRRAVPAAQRREPASEPRVPRTSPSCRFSPRAHQIRDGNDERIGSRCPGA
ncbi:hypothetical protein ACWDBD_17550 [Streptomyces sp. NPDC001118]